jgi:hypothetical protein
MKVQYPIISADSHITEAPGTYVDYIDSAWRDKAPKLIDGGEQLGDVFVVEGSQVPIPMGLRGRSRQGPVRPSHPWGEVRRAPPRRLGPDRPTRRAGCRRRRRRDHLPHRRHGAVQHRRLRPEEGVVRRLQPVDRRVLLPRTSPAVGLRADRDAVPTGGHRGPEGDQATRPPRRDDARASPRSKTTTRPCTTSSGQTAIELDLPLSFHILTTKNEFVDIHCHYDGQVRRAGVGTATSRRRASTASPPAWWATAAWASRRYGRATATPSWPSWKASRTSPAAPSPRA